MRVGDTAAREAGGGDVDGLVAEIYRAASGSGGWAAALSRMAAHLDLLGAQMIGVSPVNGAVLFSHVSDQFSSELELEYIRTYHRHDPRLPLLLQRPDGQWLYDQDELDSSVATSNPFYRELLIPNAGRHSAVVKLLTSGDELVLLGFMTHPQADGFTPAQRSSLQTLALHLREAALIYSSTRKLKAAAWAGTELLRRMPRPALLLQLDRRVGFANEGAQRYMGSGQLFLANERLTALDPRTNGELAAALDGLQADMRQGGVPRRRVVRLHGSHKAQAAALSLTAFVPHESLYTFGTQAQVLLVVHERQPEAVPDTLLWEAAFEFTPAQSRVALGLFQGLSVKETADALRVAVPTVRTHLQQVFEKTGTTRQAQLIACLAAMQHH